MTSKSTVYASHHAQTVWIRVEGKGTFQTSAGLKEYARRMVQRGCRQFVADLQDCEIMDSTFMGTLAGIALRLREVGSGGLSVIRPNIRNQQLLENLGLDHLFSFELPDGVSADPPAAVTDKPIDNAGIAPADQQRTVLTAHEALVEAAPENEERFRDVLDLLKQEVSEASNKDS